MDDNGFPYSWGTPSCGWFSSGKSHQSKWMITRASPMTSPGLPPGSRVLPVVSKWTHHPVGGSEAIADPSFGIVFLIGPKSASEFPAPHGWTFWTIGCPFTFYGTNRTNCEQKIHRNGHNGCHQNNGGSSGDHRRIRTMCDGSSVGAWTNLLGLGVDDWMIYILPVETVELEKVKTESVKILVLWNINFIFPYIGLLIIPIDSYFSEGWPNHQPGKDIGRTANVSQLNIWKTIGLPQTANGNFWSKKMRRNPRGNQL